MRSLFSFRNFPLIFSLMLFAEDAVPVREVPVEATREIGNGTWETVESDGRKVMRLVQPGKIPGKPVRRPAAFRLLPGGPVKQVQLDLEARTRAPDTKGADIILVFGYQDPVHFYYAHISNDADGRAHSVIMKVEGSKEIRTPVHRETDIVPALNEGWQHLRLIRKADGTTEIYVDDMGTPHLTTDDPTWPTGRIGFGSFNDPAEFRKIQVR